MYTIGFDIGSASSKVVVLKEGKEIKASAAVQLGTGTSGPEKALSAALQKADLSMEQISYTVSTGYGRKHCDAADKDISEISCHALGVFTMNPGVRTLIDVGGQDAKAIFLDDKGRVEQFFMNDKCAAGTGRFLDVMARVLETEVSDLAAWDEQAKEIAPVSSTCTVFAESEVISLLSNGVPKADIIAGVHQSVAVKAAGLVGRGRVRDVVAMSGGVAQNSGVVKALQRILGHRVEVMENPQLMGAYGAAIYAYREALKREEHS